MFWTSSRHVLRIIWTCLGCVFITFGSLTKKCSSSCKLERAYVSRILRRTLPRSDCRNGATAFLMRILPGAHDDKHPGSVVSWAKTIGQNMSGPKVGYAGRLRSRPVRYGQQWVLLWLNINTATRVLLQAGLIPFWAWMVSTLSLDLPISKGEKQRPRR